MNLNNNKFIKMRKFVILFSVQILVGLLFLISTLYAITDEELQQGMPIEEIQKVPPELLPILKSYFPQDIIDDSLSDVDFFKPYYYWAYGFVDLDGIGAKNYLIILYTNGSLTTMKILKKDNNSYTFVWVSSALSYLNSGISKGFELVDIDNNGRPDIKVLQHSFGGNPVGFNEPIFLWTDTEARLITPSSEILWTGDYELIDLDRNGTLEMVTFDYDEERDVVQREIYTFNGDKYVFDREIEYEDNRSFSLLALIQIKPLQWNLEWVNPTQSLMGNIEITLSGIDENHNVDEIDLLSVRLEERVKPLRVVIENEKLWIEFDKQEVMTYLSKFPRLEPLQPGNKIDVTISAILNSGQYVSGSSEIEIAASIESTIEIQPDKWNIHWLKEDKEKDEEKEHPGKGKIKCYIGNIAEHTVDDILPETILLNNTVSISEHGKKEKLDTKVKKHCKEFEGEVLEVKFNKFEAIKSLGEVKQGDTVTVTVSGKLSDGKNFKGEDIIQIIGKEPEE